MITSNYRTVTSDFRAAIQKAMPGIDKNPRYWHLFEWLAFWPHKADEQTSWWIAPAKILAELEGKVFDSNYVAFDYLTSFSNDVCKLEWSDHSGYLRKARCIKPVQWPEAVQKCLDNELWMVSQASERVILTTGQKLTDRKVGEYRRWLRDEALGTLRDNGCEQAEKLLRYLNDQRSGRYSRVLENLDSALRVAQDLGEKGKREAGILHMIKDQAQPFYKQVERSTRLFSMRAGILSLKKKVRRALTQSWIEVDLKSAHLAVAASQWRLPPLEEFLYAGGDIWETLTAHIERLPSEELTAVLKTFLYCLIYGGGERRLRRLLKRSKLFKMSIYSHLMTHPILTMLWEARNEKMAQIGAAGGATDIYGRWVSAESYGVPSVLAQCNQAVELFLLFPCVELCEGTEKDRHGCVITLWQHDGFSFAVNDSGDRDLWLSKFQEAVSVQAALISCPTALVEKKDEPDILLDDEEIQYLSVDPDSV